MRGRLLKPDELETVEEVETWSLGRLGRAAADAKSPMRTVALATRSSEAGASARMVILRRFDRSRRVARIFTDARSSKVQALEAAPACTLLFWDPRLQVQMRATAQAAILRSGSAREAELAWLRPDSLRDYAADAPPGAPLPASCRPAYEDAIATRTFTLIDFTLESLDWLHLSRGGHRRAVIDWRNAETRRSWVQP